MTDDRSIEMRTIPEAHLCRTREDLRLDEFLDDAAGRRSRYFELIDELFATFEEFLDVRPSELAIRPNVANGLGLDPAFRRYAGDRAGSDSEDADRWEQIQTAAAGTVLFQYVKATDQGEWPR